MWAIGAEQQYDQIALWQVVARTAVVFFIALFLIRIGKRRFMGDFSAFDILLGFIVGSVMARAVTGAISIVNMIVVVAVLLGLHWLISSISYYWAGFESAVEDNVRKLIEDGRVDQEAIQKSKLTMEDLKQALRENGGVESPEEVKAAYLERDGSITVIPKDSGRVD